MGSWALAHGLATLLAAGMLDAVHAHSWLSGLAALIAVRDLGIPVVHSCHTLAPTG